MQKERPVAYASRVMSQAEQNYAQIEKEALTVLYACEHFREYVYGKPITVQSDHKPLESIFKKCLNKAPKRLQRMVLKLEPYDIHLHYLPGKQMLIADTLSRDTKRTATR